MSKQEHTPLPWSVEQGAAAKTWIVSDAETFFFGHIENKSRVAQISTRDSAVKFVDARKREQANADLIVRAVNCHDDLVAALRYLVDETTGIVEEFDGFSAIDAKLIPAISAANAALAEAIADPKP